MPSTKTETETQINQILATQNEVIEAHRQALKALTEELSELKSKLKDKTPLVTTGDQLDEVKFPSRSDGSSITQPRDMFFIPEEYKDSATHYRFCSKHLLDWRKSMGYSLVDYDEMFGAENTIFTKTPEGHVQVWDTLLMKISKDDHDKIVREREMVKDKRETGIKERFHNNAYRAGMPSFEVDRKTGRELS